MEGLTAQMIVSNEDQWVWYAITSVVNYVSHFLIFDTGSKDKTVRIIKTFPQDKVTFEEKGLATPERLVQLRQEQLERTKTDWFLIIDGDEVWPEKSIKHLVTVVNSAPKAKAAVVVKSLVCLGDILHFQEKKAGKYLVGGRQGHYNIRAYRKIKSYHWRGIYPDEAYVDQNNIPIQNQKEKLIFIDDYYWHLRHLKRSSKFPNKKKKLELGLKVDRIKLPQVFYQERPDIIPSPWITYSLLEKSIAAVLTPLRKLKRKLL